MICHLPLTRRICQDFQACSGTGDVVSPQGGTVENLGD